MNICWRSVLSLGFLLTFTVARAAAANSGPELPDWVVQAAQTNYVPSGGHPKAVALLEEKQLTVDPDGKITERYRQVVKILRPEGRYDANAAAWFNKDYKLLSFHVWSIGPDGHRYALKNDQIVERGSMDGGILYDDVRYKTAEVPGSDPGCVVAYEYTRRIPLYAGTQSWLFQNSIPTVRSVFEIDLPPGWNYRALWRKYSSVAPLEVAPNHFRWVLTGIPAIDLESVSMAPAEEALAAGMGVYFSASPLPEGPMLWTRIGEWYTQLAASRTEGTGDIANTARALTSANADLTERLQKVAAFMQQQVRYVAIEIGIGGYIPHTAEEVYRNRYGDCKDKVTLLIAMLDAVGVRATWMLVDTDRGVIDPNLPSMRANHVIAAIELPQGYENASLRAIVTAKTGKRYLIFDPTNQYVPVGLLPTYLQGGYGLLMTGDDSEAVALPVLKPGTDVVDRTATFSLSADGSLTGNVTVKRLGASSGSLRRLLATSSDKERRVYLEHSLQDDFSSFQVNKEEIENVQDLDRQLILRYDVSAASYAKTAGNLLLVRPRVIGTDALSFTDESRRFPIEFDSTGNRHDRFDVKIPAGYVIDDLPDPVHLDMGFASYDSEVKADGNLLHYSRDYVVKTLELAPAQYGALRRFEDQIYTDENRNAVLKKAD